MARDGRTVDLLLCLTVFYYADGTIHERGILQDGYARFAVPDACDLFISPANISTLEG